MYNSGENRKSFSYLQHYCIYVVPTRKWLVKQVQVSVFTMRVLNMMIRSKFTFLTWPLIIALIGFLGKILFTVFSMAPDNVEGLANLVVVANLAIQSTAGLVIIMMLKWHTRELIIHDGTLEVRHLLGLSTRKYGFDTLKFSPHPWTKKLFLLELPDGRQIMLSNSQYENFDALIEALRLRVPQESLKFKLVNSPAMMIAITGLLISLQIYLIGQR